MTELHRCLKPRLMRPRCLRLKGSLTPPLLHHHEPLVSWDRRWQGKLWAQPPGSDAPQWRKATPLSNNTEGTLEAVLPKIEAPSKTS